MSLTSLWRIIGMPPMAFIFYFFIYFFRVDRARARGGPTRVPRLG